MTVIDDKIKILEINSLFTSGIDSLSRLSSDCRAGIHAPVLISSYLERSVVAVGSCRLFAEVLAADCIKDAPKLGCSFLIKSADSIPCHGRFCVNELARDASLMVASFSD